MKRKIIVLLSSLILCIPFITPVYADTITYWDGSYFGTDPYLNTILQQEVSQGGKRYRSNYKPDETVICYYSGYQMYGMLWYIGQYSAVSTGTADANYFKEQLKVYIDTVNKNSNVYTSAISSTSYSIKSIQVGSNYRIYLLYYNYSSTRTSSPLASVHSGKANTYRAVSNSTADNTWWAFRQILGYDTVGANGVLSWGLNSDTDYQWNSGLYPGYFSDNVSTAFSDSTITAPNGGNGPGSINNDSTGVGNGIPSGSGQVGSSTITFDGSENQVQNQSQYQTQSIESNAVNVTVNNEISSGGNSSGSTESDVDRINALDNLLSNQNIDTSFNSAIQNINNFRQLGVAFADTTTVFLGWLPSWVTALLGLMFTLLFFFIILRLLKVFHG